MNARALLLCTLLLPACHDSLTEALLTVSASGLAIGTDVTDLRIVVTDTASGFAGVEQTIVLCPDTGAPPSGCRALPQSMVLYPGPKMPEDPVRIVVEGHRGTTLVLSNTALMTFTHGVRQRLEVVLYGNCLNHLECSNIDSICGPDGQCVQLSITSDRDLGGEVVDASDQDLSTQDAAMVAPTCGQPGLPCCGARPTAKCAIGVGCFDGACEACGGDGQRCCAKGASLCATAFGCDATFHCTTCGKVGQPCCGGDVCASSQCIFGVCAPTGCGGVGQPCCADNNCAGGLICDGLTTTCTTTACAAIGAACCAGNTCASRYDCDTGGACLPCGQDQQEACTGPTGCQAGYAADPFAAMCGLCTAQGSACCGGVGGVCESGMHCTPVGGAGSVCM